MKITPCSSVAYSRGIAHTNLPKTKPVTPKFPETTKEPDYGKNMKQLSYVIGVSVLGISSIILGTKGKIYGIKI